ncbi:MAG TPA: type III secretion system outer membrane ring subunit SctC [Burkholderiaceae bacterium]|nr:type III secretion system outer membrane ring subunit SctC [Burkholderiaceae bacterium]
MATARPQRLRHASDGSMACLLRLVALALAAVVMLAASTVALAAPMPNAGRNVSITAREQPIGVFLQNLFAAIDVPATISGDLKGNVNGTFVGPADKVLRDVTRVYSLITYYDGSVMHVVPSADLTQRTFALNASAGDRLLRSVNELGLPDARNYLTRTSDGNMFARGTRRFVEQIDDLLRAAQAQQVAPTQNSGVADFRVFYLRYAWAQDTTMAVGGRQVVIPGVASILRSLVGAYQYAPIGREVLLKPTLPSLKGKGLAGQGVSHQEGKRTPAEARNDAVDVLVAALARTAQAAEAPQQQQTTMPEGMQVHIEADPRMNAIIVRDLAERLPRYEQLIAALDVEPQTLEIEATIIDVNTDKARELGINWRWNNDGREASFSGSVPTIGPGGIASAVLGSAGQFLARIRALQTEGVARVVSSPQVVTLSNVEAVFDNSSTFFVRVAGREQVDLFNVSAGTQLRVTPHVFRDRDQTRIKLLVNVEDGTLSNRQVDQIPVVDRSTVNTQALIAEGESLLIGGMVRETNASGEDKVPGLGDVPVVGNLFKTTTKQTARIERMFLITPRMAGSRPAPASTTLRSAQSSGSAAPAPTPAAPQNVQVAAPAPAPVAAQPRPAAPAVAPPARASVVVDLDAMPARPGPLPAAPAAATAAAAPATQAAAPPSGRVALPSR